MWPTFLNLRSSSSPELYLPGITCFKTLPGSGVLKSYLAGTEGLKSYLVVEFEKVVVDVHVVPLEPSYHLRFVGLEQTIEPSQSL